MPVKDDQERMRVRGGEFDPRLLERARGWLHGIVSGPHVPSYEASLALAFDGAVAEERADVVEFANREGRLRAVEGDFWRGHRSACFWLASAVARGEHVPTPGNHPLSDRAPVVVAHVQQPGVTPDGRSPSGETDPGHAPLATRARMPDGRCSFLAELEWIVKQLGGALIRARSEAVLRFVAEAPAGHVPEEAFLSTERWLHEAEVERDLLRKWFQYLVDFVRRDQCTPNAADPEPCLCCPDYLQVAEHAAKQAGLFDRDVPADSSGSASRALNDLAYPFSSREEWLKYVALLHRETVEACATFLKSRAAKLQQEHGSCASSSVLVAAAEELEKVLRAIAPTKEEKDPMTTGDHIMQFFAWSHLPEALQKVSKPFGDLAVEIVAELPRNPERTVALRKLLEAKDAAVRAAIAKDPT